MKPTTLISLMAMAGSTWAASPYDISYGIQWNFMIGTNGVDMGGGSRLDVTSDGTVFIQNRTGVSTWGSGTGGNVRGGLGAITPFGGLLYGTTVSSLPTLNAAGQQYAAGVSTVGNKAYFTVYGAQGQFWTGEDGKDANRAMVWSLDSSGLSSIADQRSLSRFTNAAGNPARADLLQPVSTGLTPAAGQNRIAASDLRDSTLDLVMVNDMIDGDFGTAGDYGGYNLNQGAAPAPPGNSFQPGIGVYNFTTNTLSGPAKQPIVTYTGAAETWSNHSSYTVAGIDQSTGRYYGAGPSHARATSTSNGWDPDGSGPAAPILFANSTSSAITAAIGTAYDSSHSLLYSVTWDTAGFDIIAAIAPTDDGSNGVFWAGEKLDDCHIELRDASGAVVWSDTFDMSPAAGDPLVPGVERIINVKVEASGDLLVSGYFENGGAGGGNAAFDNFLRKYKKTAPNTYVVQWTTTVGLAGIRDLTYDSALDPTDRTLYLLSETFGQWPTPNGFVYAGNSDLLVQKLTAGDFNTDGLVDFVDVQIAGTATKPGLPGVDTYDFDGDGDSTLADTTFMITKIMDRFVGDVAQDKLVSDVDNADIGKLIGSLGNGTLYLDGDIDFDGTVDSDDLTAMTGAFTGSKPGGGWTNGTAGAKLIYRASDGRVWISAEEATGGIITSFQLENAQGTFAAASYTGPAEGSFGGGLKDVTTHVIADTDLTLAGASGIPSLGTVFPTGMNQAGLEAYLKTAVYTGEPGSGQMHFTLIVGNLPTSYEKWADGPFAGTLDDLDSMRDFDNDGLTTGIEYVVGGDPTASDSAGVTPVLDNTSDPDYFIYTYRLSDVAAGDTTATILVQYGSDLDEWSNAVHDGDTVVIDAPVPSGTPGVSLVKVKLKRTLAEDGKLFARLAVSGLPATLFSEDFESGDGGFTVATTGGSAWQYGAPATPNPGGGAVTGGNSGKSCWGTALNSGYAANTNTKLRSSVIDLSGVSTATLSFAQALDIQAPHTLVVNVIEEATDAIVAGGAAVHTSTPDPDINNAAWSTVGSITIPGGMKVRIEWHFVGNGDGSSYLGAYIDDVEVSTP
jgi:hypothetical protein